MSEIRTIVDALIERKVPDEALGVWRPAKRIFGVARPTAIVPAGRAWRLGALLIDSNGTLYATGKLTRAIVPKDFNADKSLAGEAHREIQRAAARGAFRTGESVNYEWTRLDLAAPQNPLSSVDGVLQVTDGAVVPLEAYLRERLELLS